MKRDSEKYEDIFEYELKALEEIKRNLIEGVEERRGYIYLVKGAASGFILGIGLSIFALSFLPLIEVLSVGKYDETFVGNLVLCMTSLILIIFVFAYLYVQIRRGEKKLELSKESIDIIEYAIKRRQHKSNRKKPSKY